MIELNKSKVQPILSANQIKSYSDFSPLSDQKSKPLKKDGLEVVNDESTSIEKAKEKAPETINLEKEEKKSSRPNNTEQEVEVVEVLDKNKVIEIDDDENQAKNV